jgi:histidyl-tRNA synthetase
MGENAKKKGFELISLLRRDDWQGSVSFDTDYENKSLKAQMRQADKIGAKFVFIIGDDEILKGEAMLRNMATKEQQVVKFDDVVITIKEKIK